jgi:hypothetical protein
LKPLISKPLIILFLWIISGCSGYRAKRNDNPFSQYGIRSISMPMFANKTALPNMSAPFTQAFSHHLSEYFSLKLHAGDSHESDAVFLGILKSDKDIRKVITPSNRKISDEDLTGNRRFFYPEGSIVTIKLRVILIKDPSHIEMQLIKSKFSEFVRNNPKVIFDEEFDLSKSFSRVNKGSANSDEGGVVNFTNNKGALALSIPLLASDAVNTFKELVLDAF